MSPKSTGPTAETLAQIELDRQGGGLFGNKAQLVHEPIVEQTLVFDGPTLSESDIIALELRQDAELEAIDWVPEQAAELGVPTRGRVPVVVSDAFRKQYFSNASMVAAAVEHNRAVHETQAAKPAAGLIQVPNWDRATPELTEAEMWGPPTAESMARIAAAKETLKPAGSVQAPNWDLAMPVADADFWAPPSAAELAERKAEGERLMDAYRNRDDLDDEVSAYPAARLAPAPTFTPAAPATRKRSWLRNLFGR